jgi:23S rRNA pseudouridine2605 synthase
MEKRLQKILAEMGIASRRKAEEYIAEGRVLVNGRVAVLGQKADPARDHIKLDGKLLTGGAEPKVYYALHKPRHVVTALEDPEDRPTVQTFLKKVRYRVYPVGRLDFDSEGLLLVTNDGELAHGVMHPSKKIPKTYQVKIKGVLDEEKLAKLRRPMRLEDGWTAPAEVRKLKLLKENSWIEVTIHEGRKRQIRRMLHRVGHPVIRLVRRKVDGIAMGPLKAGELRELSVEEVRRIKEAVGMREEAA